MPRPSAGDMIRVAAAASPAPGGAFARGELVSMDLS